LLFRVFLASSFIQGFFPEGFLPPECRFPLFPYFLVIGPLSGLFNIVVEAFLSSAFLVIGIFAVF